MGHFLVYVSYRSFPAKPCYLHMQKMHKIEVGISRSAEGKVGKFFVGNMSDERALELASKVVSEGFVFSVRPGDVCRVL